MVAHLVNGVKRFGWLVALGMISACSPPPSVTPEAAKALTWLESQVQSDGSLTNENASIATPYQARTEALGTLALVDRTPSGLADSVQADTDDSTEWVARRALSLAAARRDVMPLINSLLTRQNTDGGFGGAVGYESNSLDTAWVLLALNATGTNAPQNIASSLGFLSSNINADGSFGDGSMPATLYQTAFALTAMQQFSQTYSLSTPLNKAKAWLVAQQVAGGHYGDVMPNAIAAFALQMTTTDASVYGGAVNALKASQLANGSWGNDPYLTAVAMRTLQSAGQPPQLPTTGSVTGRVLDASTLNALVGSTAQIVQLPNVSVTADGEGKFTLANVVPGNYTLAVSKAGYNPAQLAITVSAGSSAVVGDISLAPGASSAILRGQLTDGANGGSLAGATIEVTGTAITTATSAADGSYQLSGLSPGSVTINISKTGYGAINANATLAAGGVLVFSPSLYADGAPPPTDASLQGQVLDASSGNPITGAQVLSAGLTATTDASGHFSVSGLAIGAFSAQISASGYATGATLSGTLAAGANNAGVLRLAPQVALTTSSVSGMVTDSVTNTPIAGALVAVQSTSLQVITGGDGRFSMTGITDPAFTVRISAAGYLSSTASVNGTTHAQYTTNAALTKNTEPATGPAAGVVLRSVEPSRPAIDPQSKIEIEAELYNTTTTEKQVIVTATIFDAQGNTVEEIQQSKLVNAANSIAPIKTLAPSAVAEVEFEWHNLSRSAGTYAFVVRVQDTNGRVIADGSTAFMINPLAQIGGDVSVNPPITQAGSNQPITMKANVMNFGNLPIPAGQVQLNVILDHPDTSVPSQTPASMQKLYAGAPLASPIGGSYDSAGNLYVVNSSDRKVIRIAPNGVAHVLATLPTTLSSFSVIPRDVRVDALDNVWILNTTRLMIKIRPDGSMSHVVTGITTQRQFDFDATGNAYVLGSNINGQSGNGLMRVTPSGSVSTLVSNGLASPVGMMADGDGHFVVSNYGDNTLSKITPAGKILPFVAGLNRPQGITRDNVGNLYVANSGANNIVRVTPAGVQSIFATGLNNPYALKFNSQGHLLVTNAGNNSIVQITPAGVVSTLTRSISSAVQTIKYDGQGNLYVVSADATLNKLDPAGNLTTLASGIGGPTGLAVNSAGEAFVTTTANTIVKVSNGTKTTFANAASGLTTSYGATFDSAGTLYITEDQRNRISVVAPSGQVSRFVESTVVAPKDLLATAAGDTYVLNTKTIAKLNGDTPGEIVASGLTSAISFTTAPGGGFYVIDNSTAIKKVDTAGTVTVRATIPSSQGGIWASSDDTLYFTDANNRRINKLSPGGVLSTFVQLPTTPSGLIRKPDGGFYVRYNTGAIVSVSDAGEIRSFATVSGAQGFAIDPSGRMYVTTATQVRVLDTLGVSTVFKSGLTNAGGITVNVNGDVLVAEQQRNMVTTYDATGAVRYSVAGFSAPKDIVWDGTRFVFTDSRAIFALTPGQNPRVLAEFPATKLAVANGTVYFSQFDGIYALSGTGARVPHYNDPNVTNLSGLAFSPNGDLTIGSLATGMVLSMNASRQTMAFYPGLDGLRGLAIDASDNLYVSAYSNSEIVFLEPDGKKGRVFARSTQAHDLAWLPNGELLAAVSTGMYRFTNTGSKSLVAATASGSGVRGFAVSGVTTYVTDFNDSTIRVASNDKLVHFAAGLSNPAGIAVSEGGTVYVTDQSSGTLSKYDGTFGLIASGLSSAQKVAVDRNGTAFVGGSQTVTVVAANGGKSDSGINPLLNGLGMDGLVVDEAGKITVTLANTHSVEQFVPSKPIASLPAGTVVHTVSAMVPARSVDSDPVMVEFGQWTPAHAGDYRFVVTSAQSGIAGSLVNGLHVGPHARGQMSIDRNRVAPGNATLAVQIDVQGADFTSLSKPDPANLIRSVNSASFPTAMGADSVGNIYFLGSSTGITKVAPDGVISNIPAPGSSIRGTLPIDAQGNLYVAVNTTPVRIYRVAPDGTQTQIGTPTDAVRSMVLSSRNELFLLHNSKVTKLQMDGTLSIVTTSGVNTPYSMTIDGQDNLYVQNQSGFTNPDGTFGHVITKITPDGQVSVFLTEASFEMEGNNIAGDCADNLFVTPFNWKRVGQAGEEYTIAQVIGRNGQVARILDGRPINADMRDIDFIVYDRFSNNLLIWTDLSGGRIYKLPVTCGAIGADLHVVIPAGQTTTGFATAPTTTLARADGSIELVWNLKDVAVDGQSIRFDATLANLSRGERRPAAKEAFLTFRNSFVAGDVKLPISVPQIEVVDAVTMSLSTDRTTYPANTDVFLNVLMNNADTQTVGGTLKLDIHDGNGDTVASLLNQVAAVVGNDILTQSAVFNTASTLPGSYTALAQLLADDGRVLAKAIAPFSIVASTGTTSGNATLLGSSVTTNKQSYGPFDTVILTGRLRNNATNTALSGLTVVETVKNADGVTVYAGTSNVSQLLAGGLKDVTFSFKLANAAPGQYTVVQQVTDASGLSDITTAGFTVLSTTETGSGLKGTVTAAPTQIEPGATVSINTTTTNLGNVDVTGLPLTLFVVDPARDAIAAQWSVTASIAKGGSYSLNRTWLTNNVAAGSYVAVLIATVGSEQLTLGTAIINVTEPVVQVKLNVTQRVLQSSRVLVLTTCRPGAAEDPTCTAARATFVDSYLTSLGIEHAVTTDEAGFRKALRSGRYNVYWISGGAEKLKGSLAEEVREAVFRGDSLIMDSVHDERNKDLDEVVGVLHRGKLPTADQLITVAGSIFTPGVLNTIGKPEKVQLAGGTQQGGYGTITGYPALVSNDYGLGKGWLATFDLVGTLQVNPTAASWKALLSSGIESVKPQSLAAYPHLGYVPLELKIENQALATDLEVAVELPAGASVIGTLPPATQLGANQPVWRFYLDEGATQTLKLSVRLAETTGALSIKTTIKSIRGGTTTVYNTYTTGITAFGPQQVSTQLVSELQVLAVTTNQDRVARDKAVVSINTALSQVTTAQFEPALASMVNALFELRKINTADYSAQRVLLDQYLQYVQMKWYQVQPAP